MIGLLALTLVAIFFLQQLSLAFYNVYLHPLSSYPGPKSWIAFPILHYIAKAQGTFDQHVVKYHKKFGDVVRFSHNSLSFTTAQAWNDIYGYGHGQSQWPKENWGPPGATPNIIFANDTDHARFRKALSHSFSDQALRLQEDLIKNYVDVLIAGLREEATAERLVDMTMWYNLTTFDIISDLAFGEPSNCLKNKGYSDFITTIFRFIKIVPLIQIARFYPFIWSIISLFMGERVKSSRDNLLKIGNDTAMKRKADRSKDGRGDFMEAMLKHNETKEEISDAELGSNAHVLFMAGSETTATLLAGATYWMLRTPKAMAKATAEVRSAFQNEQDITFTSASSKIPYTLACLEEALRMYPPVPTCLVRTTPETSLVSGYTVPANTHVGVHQMATNWSTANFHEPDSFRPERWLPETFSDEKSVFFNDNRDARQPFSVGPRNCIGKNLAFSEMRQILARVLWNFDLELDDKKQDWTNQKAYALWEKGPLVCRISARQDGK